MQVSSKTIMAAVFLGASVMGAGCENGMYDFECNEITESDYVALTLNVGIPSQAELNGAANFYNFPETDLCLDPSGSVKYRGLTAFDKSLYNGSQSDALVI